MTYCELYCMSCKLCALDDHGTNVKSCRRCGGELLNLLMVDEETAQEYRRGWLYGE